MLIQGTHASLGRGKFRQVVNVKSRNFDWRIIMAMIVDQIKNNRYEIL